VRQETARLTGIQREISMTGETSVPGGERRITVFLADDHEMVREGLAALLIKDPSIHVVGQCGDGLEVLEAVQRSHPDVVVLDIGLPGMNGVDVCRELLKKVRGTTVLILSMHKDEEFVATAIENGASGYLVKESASGELSEAVRRVARGELYLGPGIGRAVLQRLGQGGDGPYKSLTMRERQVLKMIAEGMTNPQIAEQLKLAVKTVDTHRTRLMGKLNIHDQTTLVKFALRKGLVSLR
jgi:two-component system response regulator NreC